MRSIDSHALLPEKPRFPWKRYVLDTLLALFGSMGITAIIYFNHLYPRIPNISIVYLLVVLPLAVTRGRYSAMLASVLAFLAFDFFLVPPLYLFTINRPEEWIALFIFLIDALLTGQLAAALRERAEVASRSEREARALYRLVHLTNSVEHAQAQLRVICRAVIETFAAWGVRGCSLLQADATGTLQVQMSVSEGARTKEQSTVSLSWASILWEKVLSPSARRSPSVQQSHKHSLHLIPLTFRQQPAGALRLEVLGNPGALLREEQQAEVTQLATPGSFFWTFIDQVTALIERAQLQQENLHLAVLKRTDALRAALLSSVSHDLRTPLTAIKAAASSLLQDDVEWSTEERNGFLHSIENEADRLNRLVANLLDMSRIEEGALKPDKDWYSLKALIHDVLGRMAPLLAGRSVQLDLPDDLLMVELDYLHMDQVLTNLLENAMRYTPSASPITISAHKAGDQIVFTVADRGPGIPEAHLEHVFDKFYRVMHGPVAAGMVTGSGLGLAVCKGLVEAHGGKIWAESRSEGGLLVTVALPCKELERIDE
ncbi:MAG TPA: ATP-binding protein [Ktedonobacteraceae bacterium]